MSQVSSWISLTPKDQLDEAYRVFARSERMYGYVYRLAEAVSARAREVVGTEVSGHRADVVQNGKNVHGASKFLRQM